MFEVPVLLTVFNRLEPLKKVLAAIRIIQPRYLYIAADGPRPERSGEQEQCARVRQYLLNHIDWPCELKTRFQEMNCGCGPHMSSAISWFFEEVESGIILEDDCVAHPGFFQFTETMLKRYENDMRVMHISGNCFCSADHHRQYGYYFIRYPLSWGWATWRRAWKFYDYDMKNFNAFKGAGEIRNIFPGSSGVQRRWLQIFEATARHDRNFNTWDFQWLYANLTQHALCVSPCYNLVSNIGFEATHAMPGDILALPTQYNGNCIKNEFMLPDLEIERKLFRKLFASPGILKRGIGWIMRHGAGR